MKEDLHNSNYIQKMKGGIINKKMGNEQPVSKGLIWTILVLGALSVLFSGFVFFGDKEVTVPAPVITDQDKTDIATLVLSNLPTTPPESTVTVPAAELSAEDQARLKEASKYDEEEKSKELALAEMDTKEFKKVLVDALVNKSDIDSYKDIETFTVKESDVSFHRNTGTVDVTFKVTYFENEDDDESDLQEAKVKVTLTVEDVDESDDFEDAEVSEYTTDDFKVIWYEHLGERY